MGLDDRIVLREPHPSHLVGAGPREWSLASLVPSLYVLWEDIGGEMGIEGFVVIDLPTISEHHVVGKVLANRGEINASGDTQVRKLGRIPNSREHEELWGVDRPRAQNDLFTSGHPPPLAFCPINERTHEVVHIDSLEGPVPNSTPLKVGIVVLRLVASRSFVA